MVRLAVGLETGPDSRLEVCFIKCVALGTVLQRAGMDGFRVVLTTLKLLK